MKFGIVTPCLNAEKYIEETVLSVINQSVLKKVNNSVTYVIKDGGSQDNTLNIIKNLKKYADNFPNIRIICLSEPDRGMYDALAKGFSVLSEKSKYDVYAYINADDYFSQYAFEIVLEIFNQYKDVHFLTGRNTSYNDKGHIVGCQLPFKYNKKLVIKGLYGKILPFIQQESTFWDYSAHQCIDLNNLKKMRFAGDFLMWSCIIKKYPLFIVNAYLGGFRTHEDQLTQQILNEYKKEMVSIAQKPIFTDYLMAYIYKVFWYAPDKIKKILSSTILSYDHEKSQYRLTNRST